MVVKPGDSVAVQFTTQNPSTGALSDADSTPVGTLIRNGANTAESVTISNITTGVYSATVTIPVGYSAGDEVQIRIAATVNSVAGGGVVWQTTIDTSRVSEVSASGSGAISYPIEVEDQSGTPIEGVEVWVTSDLAGNTVVAGTLTTDAFGIVTFMLDSGTYYLWRQIGTHNFDNPLEFTVS